jgi:hypothetical protein
MVVRLLLLWSRRANPPALRLLCTRIEKRAGFVPSQSLWNRGGPLQNGIMARKIRLILGPVTSFLMGGCGHAEGCRCAPALATLSDWSLPAKFLVAW